MMKKTFHKFMILSLLPLSILLCAGGCASGRRHEEVKSGTDPLNIVAANFPGYDFARQLTGENARISLLLKPGMESHAYEPSPQDIIAIENCDLFIYNGGESDSWAERILGSVGSGSGGPAVFCMMDHASLLEEEEPLYLSDSLSEAEENSDGPPEYDEHIWTSPRRVLEIIPALYETLLQIDEDAERRAAYRNNTDRYLKELEAIDSELIKITSTGERNALAVGDRFPFLYLAYDYQLAHYEAFAGCSTETEPSVATLRFLIDQIRQESIPYVFYIELSSHKVADVLAEETGAGTLLLHSCQTVSAGEFREGATYASLMRQNCENLKKALHETLPEQKQQEKGGAHAAD